MLIYVWKLYILTAKLDVMALPWGMLAKGEATFRDPDRVEQLEAFDTHVLQASSVGCHQNSADYSFALEGNDAAT